MRLKIQLFDNWSPRADLPGTAAFSRQGSAGTFQVSWAEHRADKPLRAFDDDGVRQFAINQGKDFGELVDSSGGACCFGVFGTAVFRSENYPRTQIWILTNGRDHILATHICNEVPAPGEVAEVEQIASSLALGPEQPAKAV